MLGSMEYLCSASVPSQLSGGSAVMISCPWRCQAQRSWLRMPIRAVSDTTPSQKISEGSENGLELKKNHALPSPSSFEVQSLLMEICDETSIAELELKIGSFKLRVKRDVTKIKGSSHIAVPLAPPIPSEPMDKSGVPSLDLSTPQPKPSPPSSGAISLMNPTLKGGSKVGLLEAAADEGLHFVTCPKVGWFRRSRVVKKKSGRPLCEVGQIVKEGQPLCYVEQLGTQHPVEAGTSGEVMKILCEDGEAVAYGDPLIAIRPSFAGIK